MLNARQRPVTCWLGGRPSPAPVPRIVSLVPSLSELLYDLGLEAEVVGITKFCVRPQHWRRAKTIVGGTKAIKADRILTLQPHWVLANREENVREQIEALSRHVPVLLTDVVTVDDALEVITTVAEITGRQQQGRELCHTIRQQMLRLAGLPLRSAAYLIWHRPTMAAGGDTFIHNMLQQAGFVNVFSSRPRYPECSEADLRHANPDWLLLASEPFPFSEKHLPFYRAILPQAKWLFVDGQMFSWYGSRMQHFADYVLGLRATT